MSLLLSFISLALSLANAIASGSNKTITATTTTTNNCSRNEFKCSIDNKCIPLLKVQDGTVDCIDGSDEGMHSCFFPSFLENSLNFYAFHESCLGLQNIQIPE